MPPCPSPGQCPGGAQPIVSLVGLRPLTHSRLVAGPAPEWPEEPTRQLGAHGHSHRQRPQCPRPGHGGWAAGHLDPAWGHSLHACSRPAPCGPLCSFHGPAGPAGPWSPEKPAPKGVGKVACAGGGLGSQGSPCGPWLGSAMMRAQHVWTPYPPLWHLPGASRTSRWPPTESPTRSPSLHCISLSS